MSCIVGAIMYCTAAIHVPGPVHSQPSYLGNEAWRYAAYYGPPVLGATYPTVNPVLTIQRPFQPTVRYTYTST